LARRDKSVPLGLISSSFGGTSDLQWSSPQALMKCGIFTSEDPKLSGLWNAMVVPFLKLKISAILWYQGESDCSNPAMYGCTFPQMILDWRNAFGNPKIPFGFVQLAAYDHHDADFSKIRLVQSVALGLENVFMITAVDLGDPDSMYHPIHPRNKQEVGRRLGRSLIRHLYNDSSIKKIAPSAKGAKISFDATSWTVKITFNSDSESIYLKGTAKCSACCSESPIEIYANSTWTRAQLEIQSSNSLILNGIGSLPSAVRGIWGPYPQCAFYNSENFAVPPFFFDLLH
jgi:sialate O-acetylesterase